MNSYRYEYDDFYGESIHPKALEIADVEFFWDPSNDLAPFGSDQGMKLSTTFVFGEKKRRSLE